MVTASALKAMASGGIVISTSQYREGSTSPVGIYKKDGVVYWTSGMSIDCDGQPGSKCNKTADPYFQPDTSFHQSNGQALSAENTPFIVVPLPSSIWDFRDELIVGGNLVTVVYKDRVVHGVVGDEGPTDRIGEGSYALASALGINPDPSSGGVESGVTYIVYPGVKVNPIESTAEAARLGELHAADWLAVTPEDPTGAFYTVKAGDTLSGIAVANNETVDQLVSANNLIPVGTSLVVVDPSTPPPDTKPITYVAKANDTWTSIATQYNLTVDQLMTLNNIKVAVGSSYIVGVKAVDPVPTDPYAAGLPKVNMTSPSAKALQIELKRVGYMSTSVAAADNYGPATQAGVAAFHNEHPEFSTAAYDAQIGAAGWVFLRGMAAGSGHPVVVSPLPGRITSDQVTYEHTTESSGKNLATGAIDGALAAIGIATTPAWVTGYLTIIVRESSYLPNSVNTTDSNAVGATVSDGHPFQCSRGLAQCIPQTFAQYHQAGTSLSIYDPIANVAASINYVRAVYGVANDGSNLASKVQQADPNRSPKGY